jgi:hypothetical protein
MYPAITRRDLEAAATAQDLARGRELAAGIADLDWDEYSIWATLPGEGIEVGELMIHHSDLPLCGECPSCRKVPGLCAHMTAIGWAFLGDGQKLEERLTALPHAELVALVAELADEIPRVLEAVWSRLPS